MTWIDFLLQYLALVLASLTVFGISLCLGYYTMKHLINKAMQSKEVQEFKKTIDAVKVEIEKLKKQFQAMISGRIDYIE